MQIRGVNIMAVKVKELFSYRGQFIWLHRWKAIIGSS